MRGPAPEDLAPDGGGVDGEHVGVRRLLAVEVKLQVLHHGVVQILQYVGWGGTSAGGF